MENEMDSVREVMEKEVTSAYPELNDMCEASHNSRYSQIRTALSILAYYANGGKNTQDAVYMASCIEAVYNGLHLHDKVDSDGKVRAVKKSLFSKIPSTTKVIVAGDFMFLMGFRLAYAKAPDIVPYLMKASSSISDAIFDMVDNAHNADINEDTVMDIIRRKSAIEYSILFETAAKKAGAGEDVITKMFECGAYLGLAIQTRRDIDDLFGEGKKKAVMDTLMSGSPTLPLFYAMQDPAAGAKVREAFADKGLTRKTALAAVSAIRGSEAIPKCDKFIRECIEKATEILNGLSDSKYKTTLLDFAKEV